MFLIPLLIGLYSYAILIIGIFGYLQFSYIFPTTLIFLTVAFFIAKGSISWLFLHNTKITTSEGLFIGILAILGLVNLVGALGPELAFDALWYHLTIPKVFLLEHKIYYIHGSLLYYNLMPKLTEMLYVASLSIGDEIVAKLVHFAFGVMSCMALYKLARLYLIKKWSILVVAVFYSNLVVSWLSITAYSDLSRAFYEIIACYYFIKFFNKSQRLSLFKSAILLGFAISAKILSIGSILIFDVLIFTMRGKFIKKFQNSVIFTFLSLLIPMPWFVISFINSGNPFFPLFSELGLRNFTINLLYPVNFVKVFVETFLFSSDPINPLYIIGLPFVIVFAAKKLHQYKPLILYSIFSYLIWYVTSQSGGARFLTSYLPVYSLLLVIAIMNLKNKRIISYFTALVFAICLTTLIYRLAANSRYLSVIFHRETKQAFLLKNLNFNFGDFYDENGEIKKIVGESYVELRNMHNLFYIDFPFTIPEFNDGKKASYVLVQHGKECDSCQDGKLVYQNQRTHVKLYKVK